MKHSPAQPEPNGRKIEQKGAKEEGKPVFFATFCKNFPLYKEIRAARV